MITREAVKKLVRSCVVCTKYSGKPFPHSCPPSLPESRVDDAGPLHVRKRNSLDKGITEKVYLCLFTCVSTRGIHLELAENCSAEQFLLAFRRFVARRGLPRLLMSDNAKNFKTSAKEITKIGRSTLVQEHITNVGVEWMFIVENLTHESLTKRARHHQRLLRQFTKQWKHEYLTSLRENARITKENEPHIAVGDLVILKKEGTARCFWKLERKLLSSLTVKMVR